MKNSEYENELTVQEGFTRHTAQEIDLKITGYHPSDEEMVEAQLVVYRKYSMIQWGMIYS